MTLRDRSPRNPTLLIIDDNQAHIRLLREAFRNTPTRPNICAVQDGIEALNYLYCRGDFIQATQPSLILLDLNLPRIDGRELLTEIKSDPTLRKIPVIVLSNSHRPDDISSSYQRYANCYIQKTSNLKKLLLIAQCIDEFWLNLVSLTTN